MTSEFKPLTPLQELGAATIAGIPGNIPSCTGARRQVVLGSVTPGTNFEALVARAPELRRAWSAGS